MSVRGYLISEFMNQIGHLDGAGMVDQQVSQGKTGYFAMLGFLVPCLVLCQAIAA